MKSVQILSKTIMKKNPHKKHKKAWKRQTSTIDNKTYMFVCMCILSMRMKRMQMKSSELNTGPS